jgi:hypothetical protein
MALKAEQEALLTEILNKSWSELQALEFQGSLLIPVQLKRRRADGSWETVPVMLRVPRESDLRMARIAARTWAERVGLNPQLDPDVFDNMDTVCILSRCVRNATEPHEPWEPDPEILESRYDIPQLELLWAKLEAYKHVIDPRPETMNEDAFMAMVALIAKERVIYPLVALGGRSQTNFIVTMASRLQNSLDSKS